MALHGCFVSLAEVQYIKTYDVGADAAGQIMADLKKLPLAWLHSDDALCAAAVEWKANHKLSLADAFVVAAAARLNAILVHKDPELARLGHLIQQEMLPPKLSASTPP